MISGRVIYNSMKIAVGSTNTIKVDAVKEIISEYDFFASAEVISCDVFSEVSNQPKNLDQTIRGAMNRAKNAIHNCEYSFGLESGLMKVPHTKSGYMDFCACAIYDGKKFHLGLSSCFEYPKKVIRLIFEEGLEVDEAYHQLGLTDNARIGRAEGVIGQLTKGRLKRKEYTKQAIRTALIHLENLELY